MREMEGSGGRGGGGGGRKVAKVDEEGSDLMKGEVGVDPRGGRSLMRGREGISEVERVSREGSRAHLLFLPLAEQPFQSLDRLHLDIMIQQRCSGNEDIETDASENGES